MVARNKWGPALWGGVLIGVISGVPVLNMINCACCAGIIAGGVLAVYLFSSKLPDDEPLTMQDGIVLGLLAAVIGTVIELIFDSIFGAASAEFIEMAARYVDDPDVQDALRQLQDATLNSGFIFIGMVTSLFINAIFGLVGGIIGASIFGKNRMV